jgi:hypothetical protein
MPQTTAAADAVLKEYYLTPIREQLNNRRVIMFQSKDPDGSPDTSSGESVPFRGIDKDAEGVEFAGRQWVLPAHTSRNEGIGAISEGGVIPTAGRQGWQDLKDTIRHNVGVISLTRYAIRLSNRNSGAFLKLLEGETKGLVNDISKDICRQAYGNQTGALAAVTADGANTVTVDSVQYLRVGMFIDLVNVSTDAVLASNRKITKITPSTKVVEYEGADVTATTSHRLVRTGNWKKEINGLAKLIGATGEVHAIDSTAAGNEWWQSVVMSASGASFSEDTAQQIVDSVGASGNGDVELLLTTRGVRRRYVADLKSQKRFTDSDSVKLHGGFKAIMFNEMPLVYDDDLPKGNMFMLNTDALMWVYLEKDWDWVDDDGSILSRATDRSDAFEGYLAADHDLAVTARNQLGKYTELADDAAGTWK